MSHIHDTYPLEQGQSIRGLIFTFISKGRQDIIKVVQYSFVQKLNGKDVYNFGFGDYDLENDTIVDNVNSNNGDAYKVFNTVLSTVPIFFENYTDCILMVQGSDGRPEFLENCRITCAKKCDKECRNFNRRINIYRNYVDRNYEQLVSEYGLWGGTKDEYHQIFLDLYVRYKRYNSVFLFKKNV